MFNTFYENIGAWIRLAKSVPDKVSSLSKMSLNVENYIPDIVTNTIKQTLIEPSFNKNNSPIAFTMFQQVVVNGRQRTFLLCGFKSGFQVMEMTESSTINLVFSKRTKFQPKLLNLWSIPFEKSDCKFPLVA